MILAANPDFPDVEAEAAVLVSELRERPADNSLSVTHLCLVSGFRSGDEVSAAYPRVLSLRGLARLH